MKCSLELELSHHRRANVWLDEAPPAAYATSSAVTKVVMPKTAIHAARRIAGVEFMFPQGPMPPYALRGAELVEANVNGLEVIVSVNEVGAPFPASIAVKTDEVKIGLLGEYADAVISGVAKITETIGAPKKAEPAVWMGSARSRGFVCLREGEWYRAPTAHAVLRLGRSHPRAIRVRGNPYSSSRPTGRSTSKSRPHHVWQELSTDPTTASPA
jgi:hypothetical protein